VAGATIVLGIARDLPTATALELAAWLLPALLEYTAVQTSRLPYHPGRTWIFGGLMGLGTGRLLHRYLLDPSDLVVWGIGGLCILAGLVSIRWRTQP
jgi:hypothetical protein